MFSNLELRLCGSTASSTIRVSFDNLLSTTINHEAIVNEALNLGGNVVNESLILFTSETNLLKLVQFIASL